MSKEALNFFASRCARDKGYFLEVVYDTRKTVDAFQPPLDQREKDCIVEAVGAIPPDRMGQNLEELRTFVFSYATGCLGISND